MRAWQPSSRIGEDQIDVRNVAIPIQHMFPSPDTMCRGYRVHGNEVLPTVEPSLSQHVSAALHRRCDTWPTRVVQGTLAAQKRRGGVLGSSAGNEVTSLYSIGFSPRDIHGRWPLCAIAMLCGVTIRGQRVPTTVQRHRRPYSLPSIASGCRRGIQQLLLQPRRRKRQWSSSVAWHGMA